MNTPSVQIGRLAFREEGENWNAYYAMPDTMVDATYLGSIRRAFVENPERKNSFMALMRECVADIIEENTGVRPTWGGPRPAPSSDRSGEG